MPGAQRAGQFHHLAHAVGQADHQAVAVVLKVEEFDHLLDLAAELERLLARERRDQRLTISARGGASAPRSGSG